MFYRQVGFHNGPTSAATFCTGSQKKRLLFAPASLFATKLLSSRRSSRRRAQGRLRPEPGFSGNGRRCLTPARKRLLRSQATWSGSDCGGITSSFSVSPPHTWILWFFQIQPHEGSPQNQRCVRTHSPLKFIFKKIFSIFYSYLQKILYFIVQFAANIYLYISRTNQLTYILYISHYYHFIIHLNIHTYIFLGLYIRT
jgi:hypothetical protein